MTNSNSSILKETSITCRTYVGDKPWLPYLIRSIERFVPIRKEFVIVYEEKDDAELRPLIPDWIKVVREEKFADGRIQQKYSKLTADLYCTGKYMIHIDTDSIFCRNLREDYMFRNGKPILEYTPYQTLIEWSKKTGGANPILWKGGTENAVGCSVDYEFSRRPEKIYPREMYKNARESIERKHGISFKEFMSQQFGAKFKDDPKDRIYFSDFNYMGAYLWYEQHNWMSWVNTDVEGYSVRPTFILQMNSYRMLDRNREIKSEVKEFLETVLASDGETSFENHPDLHYWRDGKRLRNTASNPQKNDASSSVHHLTGNSEITKSLAEIKKYQQNNKLDRALETYSQLVGMMSQELSDVYLLLGNLYREEEKLDLALTYYQKYSELQPDIPDIHFYLGTIYFKKQQFDAAIEHYQKCLTLNPNLADAHFYLGTIYYNQQQMEEAATHYQKCIGINPSVADAHFYLGLIYFQQQKFEEAIAYYQKCSQLRPDLADTYFYLGSCYRQQNNLKDALVNYDKCVQLNPNCSDAYFGLAGIHFQENRLDRSKAFYEKCLQLDASLKDAYFYIGEIYIKQGKVEQAIEYHKQYRAFKGKKSIKSNSR